MDSRASSLKPLNADITRKTYYGDKAALYDKNNDETERREKEREAVAEFLSGAKGRVLDCPVGTGVFIPLYRSLGLDYIGLDVSEEMLAQAREKDPSGDLSIGDVFNLDLRKGAVETAVCIRLLSLITEDEMAAAVRELGRVARKRIVMSLRIGREQKRRNRAWTHRLEAFDAVLDELGMTIEGRMLVSEPDEFVILAER